MNNNKYLRKVRIKCHGYREKDQKLENVAMSWALKNKQCLAW